MHRAAAALLLLVVMAASAVSVASRWTYKEQDRAAALGSPVVAFHSAAHPLGIDDLGRDRAVRLSVALLLSLAGAAVASALTTALGTAVGAAAGFAPRPAATALMYASDLLLTLPWLFLLMIVRAALPLNLSPAASATVTFLLLGALGWPAFARVHFARTRALRGAGWMLGARAAGVPPARLLLRHVLPHLRPVMLAQFLLYLPVCITAEANLGTLGLGVSEPLPSFGSMLYSLRSAALLSGTSGVYLPVAVLVAVLLVLEMLVFREEA